MNLSAIVQEKFQFLNKFIQSPKEVGSVTPSSKYLAQAMTAPLPWHEIRAAAELGAGTGALTKYIQSAARPDARILLFEKDPALRGKLEQRYPDFTCSSDACHIGDTMRAEGIQELDAIISGLPFFNFPPELREKLMTAVHDTLRPGGYFIAFQYSLQMKQQLRSCFDIDSIRFVPMNLPPAFVYVCRKRSGRAR